MLMICSMPLLASIIKQFAATNRLASFNDYFIKRS